jgi:uncharacterized membrane protein SirB2
MDYTSVRALHIGCATLSIALFSLRAGLALADVNWRQWHWLRVVPHLNDTVLLTAAIALATMSQQAPWALPWLGAKVVALFFYVALGSMALRPHQKPFARQAYTLLALLTVAFIVGAALTRSASLNLL